MGVLIGLFLALMHLLARRDTTAVRGYRIGHPLRRIGEAGVSLSLPLSQ